MIIQNLAPRFSLYNNLWLKKLNEMESGVSKLQKKKAPPPQAKPQPQPKAERAPGSLPDPER